MVYVHITWPFDLFYGYLCPFVITFGHLVYLFYGYLVYFMVIWYFLWLFGIFCGYLVYFMVIWYIFPVFFIFFCEISKVLIFNHVKSWFLWLMPSARIKNSACMYVCMHVCTYACGIKSGWTEWAKFCPICRKLFTLGSFMKIAGAQICGLHFHTVQVMY
jgi:hypothetical protein